MTLLFIKRWSLCNSSQSEQTFENNAAKVTAWLSRLSRFCQSLLGHLLQEPSAASEEPGSLRLPCGEMAQRGSCPRSLSSTSPQRYNSSRPQHQTCQQRHLWDELPAPSDPTSWAFQTVLLPCGQSSLDSWAKEMISSVLSCCFGVTCFMARELGHRSMQRMFREFGRG